MRPIDAERDFAKEWAARAEKRRQEEILVIPELPRTEFPDSKEPPKLRIERFAPPIKGKEFHIYKRSLPPGLDKIVIWNVSKEEAEWLIENRLKTKLYFNDATDSKTYIYYDVLPANATPEERSIYHNKKPVIIE